MTGSKQSELSQQIDAAIASKTMPAGALGQLIPLAKQIALLQQTLKPVADTAQMIVFASDHGIANDGVSAFPQEVTWQMVENFLAGGAAINVFAKTVQCPLVVVDAGVAHTFGPREGLIDAKIAMGTQSSLHGPAMTVAQAQAAMNQGGAIADQFTAQILAFGEMGIGNTSAAALITAAICKLSISACTGRGTGVDDAGLAKKITILEQVHSMHKHCTDPLEILASVGGFEIAMITGAMITGARHKKIILVDGFIATSAALIAQAIDPSSRAAMVFAHQSAESGHASALAYLHATPLLQLGLRLGEGTGAALAIPLVRAAAAFLRDMASFDSAAVSGAN